MMAPFLFTHDCAFSVFMSKCVFTQSEGAVYLEHAAVTTRTDVKNDLHVYDCSFNHIRTTDASGGAIYVCSDVALVTLDRTTFIHCTSGKIAGAMFLEVEHTDIQHTRIVDCKATQTNNMFVNASQDCIIDCSTVYTDNSGTFSDSSLQLMASNVICHNWNVSREDSRKENSAGLYQASHSIDMLYCTFQECEAHDYVLSLETLGHTQPDVFVQFSNVYNNSLRADTGFVVRVEGFKNFLQMVTFSGTPDRFYLVSHEGLSLVHCAFDVSKAAAIEPETSLLLEEGCIWDDPEEEIHSLWVGDDEDYATLQTHMSETYVQSRAKSVYFVETKFCIGETRTYVRSYSEVLTPPPTATPTATPEPTETQHTTPTASDQGDQGISEGTKVAIGVAVPVVLLLLAGFIWFVIYFNRRMSVLEREVWTKSSGTEEALDPRGLLA